MVFVLSRRGTFLCLRIQFTQRSCLLTYACFCNALQEGTVLAFDPSSGTVKIELSKESLKKSLGDGNVTGKFDLVYDENEENGNDEEEETETVVPWNSMIDPVLVE